MRSIIRSLHPTPLTSLFLHCAPFICQSNHILSMHEYCVDYCSCILWYVSQLLSMSIDQHGCLRGHMTRCIILNKIQWCMIKNFFILRTSPEFLLQVLLGCNMFACSPLSLHHTPLTSLFLHCAPFICESNHFLSMYDYCVDVACRCR